MTKTDKLLAVLDLPEEEQVWWVFENVSSYQNLCGEKTLADLAFRLRDEWAGKLFSRRMSFPKGLKVVWKYKCKKHEAKIAFDYWLCLIAQPIHWIIAALIVKELANGKT